MARVSDEQVEATGARAADNFNLHRGHEHDYSDSIVMGLCLDLRDERQANERLRAALAEVIRLHDAEKEHGNGNPLRDYIGSNRADLEGA